MNESLTTSKGGCKDHAEYKERCGRIKGLESAIHIVREMARQAELSDEDQGPEMGDG